jgi:hypothetical protein
MMNFFRIVSCVGGRSYDMVSLKSKTDKVSLLF